MLLIEASPPVLASPLSGGLATLLTCNEAEPSSRDATARAFAFPSFNGRDRSHPLKGRLHDFRSFIMVNTFQFTRTTKLAWRFPAGRRGGNLAKPGQRTHRQSMHENEISQTVLEI